MMHSSQPSIPSGRTAATRIPQHRWAADDAEEERQVEGQELGYLKGWYFYSLYYRYAITYFSYIKIIVLIITIYIAIYIYYIYVIFSYMMYNDSMAIAIHLVVSRNSRGEILHHLEDGLSIYGSSCIYIYSLNLCIVIYIYMCVCCIISE